MKSVTQAFILQNRILSNTEKGIKVLLYCKVLSVGILPHTKRFFYEEEYVHFNKSHIQLLVGFFRYITLNYQ